MDLIVREMRLDEVDIRIDYFLNADSKALDLMGVDPAKRPSRTAWRKVYADDYAKPIERRQSLQLLWLDGDQPIGFSSVDAIEFGQQANMHLHVLEAINRRSGYGVECVRKSAKLYFESLRLQRLFCQPNAFNVAPNRTLQKAGFKYVKTFMATPSSLNFHQAITQWQLSRNDV